LLPDPGFLQHSSIEWRPRSESRLLAQPLHHLQSLPRTTIEVTVTNDHSDQ
jgi:hypothetical protein